MTERTSHEVETLTIRIPIRLKRRGGRKLIMTPEGVTAPAPKPRRDDTLIKALVRAHRWRRQIESGRAKSITDLAEQEGVTDAYVCRLLPLTCRAPDIVEAIPHGRQPKGLRLAGVLGSGPRPWEEQSEAPGISPRPEGDLCVLVCFGGPNRRTQSGSSTKSQHAPNGARSRGPTAEPHQTTQLASLSRYCVSFAAERRTQA
jgi:hypothetical protein